MFKTLFFSKIVTLMSTWNKKNIVELDSPQITVRRMRIACWITKATDTHSEYVILRNNGCMQAPHWYKHIACHVVVNYEGKYIYVHLALDYKLTTIYLQDLFCTQKPIPWPADELLGGFRDTPASTAMLLYVFSQGFRSVE